MRHTNLGRKLRFEALETRRLLDGNVTTSFSGGVLTLHGDSTSNGVEIFNTSANVVEVLGLNQGTPATPGGTSPPTTIDGGTNGLFQHVVSVVVDFTNGTTGVNQGDDAVVLTNLTLSGSVSVQLGNGNDIVGLGQFDNSGGLVDSAVDGTQGTVRIDNGLVINLQSGNNTVVAKSVTLDGPAGPNLTITGGGVDSISFDHVAVNHAIAITDTGSTTIDMTQGLCNSLRVSLGIGNDSVSIDHTTVGHTLSIKADAGDDSVSLDNIGAQSLQLDLGAGNDHAMVTNAAITHDTMIKGDDGNDTVSLDTVTTRPLNVNLGDGDDILTLNGITSKMTEIHGGTGADTISASNAHATIFMVLGGSGADQITLDSITASKRISLDAGADVDAVTVDNSAARSMSIDLGAGNDTLSLGTDTVARKTLLLGSGGTDTITADTLASGKLSAILGTGDDEISLANSTIAGKAKLRGGPGSDTYTDATGNTFGKLDIKQIETT